MRAAKVSEGALLSRHELVILLGEWEQAWNAQDLDRVMDLFHEEILFDHWSGLCIRGKKRLRRIWRAWFATPDGFRFTGEDVFFDEVDQQAVYRWRLEWPSPETAFRGESEVRRGIDILKFQDGKIIEKLTYCKTTLEIDGKHVPLLAHRPQASTAQGGA